MTKREFIVMGAKCNWEISLFFHLKHIKKKKQRKPPETLTSNIW